MFLRSPPQLKTKTNVSIQLPLIVPAFIFIFILSLHFAPSVQGEILFEGYSKVTSGGVHAGFTVTRYEFDPKKKNFSFTYLLRTNELAGNLTESIKAVSTETMVPVSYAYTSLAGSQSKTIDAKFSANGHFLATIKEGSKISKINKKLPKGVFFSYFLVYEMLIHPKGISPGTKYDYLAISEEDGALTKGVAFVKGIENYHGIKAYKIMNEFKGTKFISYVTEKGEILSATSPVHSIATELVAQPSLATGQFQMPTSLLKTLFGEVPQGNKNELSKLSGKANPDKNTEKMMPSKNLNEM